MRALLILAILGYSACIAPGCAGTQSPNGVAWKLLVNACRVVEAIDASPALPPVSKP